MKLRLPILLLSAVLAASAMVATTSNAADLTWVTGSGDWDNNTSTPSPWNGGAIFQSGDNVIFGDVSGQTDITVTLKSLLYPGNMLFNAATSTYTIAGSGVNSSTGGRIGGSGGITKTNAGKVIIALLDSLDFEGDVNIEGGALQWGTNLKLTPGTVSLGQGNIIVHDGATFTTHFDSSVKNEVDNTARYYTISNNIILLNNSKFGAEDGGYNLQGDLTIQGSATWVGSPSGWSGILLNVEGKLIGDANTEWIINGSSEGAGRINSVILSNNSNDFHGSITVNGGTGNANAHTDLRLRSNTALNEDVPLVLNGTSGSARLIADSGVTSVRLKTINANDKSRIEFAGSGSLYLTGQGDSEIAGSLSDSLSIVKMGAGKLSLHEQNNYTNLTIQEGTVEMTGSRAAIGTGSVSVDGTLIIDVTVSEVLTTSFSGSGLIEKRNGNIIEFDGTSSFTGTLKVAGGTVTTTKTAGFGHGTLLLDGGVIDFARTSNIDALVKVNQGIFLNAGHLTRTNVVIEQTSAGGIELGGLNATLLSSVNTGGAITGPNDTATVITGITGNGHLTSPTILGISSDMIADNNNDPSGAVFQFQGEGSLTIGDLNITLTDAAATKLIDALGTTPQFIHVANVTTNITGSINFQSPYHALSWLYEASPQTTNGWIGLAFADGGSRRLIVRSGETFDLNSYNQPSYDLFTGVTNNGLIKVTLGNAPSATDGVVILDLEGSNSAALIDTSASTDNSRIILRDNGVHDSSLYQGSIKGNSQILKDGADNYTLTINGEVTGSRLEVANGALVLNNNVSIKNDTEIAAGASLNVSGPNVATGGNLTLGGTLNVGPGTTVTAGALSGTGSAVLNNGTLNLVTAPTLDARIDGTGTFGIQNGQLTLGTNGAMGESIVLNLEQNASFLAAAANNDKNIIGGLTGSGTLVMDGSILQIANQGGTFSGALDASAPSTIIYSGSGNQTFAGAGSSMVSISQAGTGSVTLSSEGTKAYNDLEVVNGSMTNVGTLNANSLSVGPGGTYNARVNSSGAQSTTTLNDMSLAAGGKVNVEFDPSTVASGTPMIVVNGTYTGPTGGQATVTATGTGNPFDWLADNYTLNVLQTPQALDGGAYNVVLGRYLSALGYQSSGVDFSNGIRMGIASTGQNTMQQFANSNNTGEAANAIWQARYQANRIGTLNDIFTAILNTMITDPVNSSAITDSLASFSGSSVTTMLGSTRDGLQQQVTSIRNRVTQMGLTSGNSYSDLPYYNAWIQANGSYSKLSQQGDKAGYEMDTWGGTVGFDVNVTQPLTLGLAVTANYSKVKTKAYDHGEGDNDAVYVNLFGRLQLKKWTQMLILTGGWNEVNMDRTVYINGLNPIHSNGKTDGSSYGAYYEATYDIALRPDKTAIVQPLVNASIYRSELDSYREGGAGDASMNVNKMSATYGRAGVGGRVMGLIGEANNIVGREVFGEFRAQVVQDYGDKTDQVTMTPIGTPGTPMRIHGSKVGRTGVLLGAGIAIPAGNQGTVYMDIDTDIRSRGTIVSGNLGYRYNF